MYVLIKHLRKFVDATRNKIKDFIFFPNRCCGSANCCVVRYKYNNIISDATNSKQNKRFYFFFQIGAVVVLDAVWLGINIYNREIPFEPEDPSRDNVESPRLAKGKES
jgi:hypothetical protein